jgi:hypothetical protein
MQQWTNWEAVFSTLRDNNKRTVGSRVFYVVHAKVLEAGQV